MSCDNEKYSKFGSRTKITICCLCDNRIQSKKLRKAHSESLQLNHSREGFGRARDLIDAN